MATTEWTARARKAFGCHECGREVGPGEDYARFVAFPFDGEVHQGPGLWVLRTCLACATRYGQPMPPRRNYRRAS